MTARYYSVYFKCKHYPLLSPMFTIEEKIRIFRLYNLYSSFRQVSHVFLNTYPIRTKPCPATTCKIVNRLNNNGCINNRHLKKYWPHIVLTNKNRNKVIQIIEQNKRLSAYQRANITNFSTSTYSS